MTHLLLAGSWDEAPEIMALLLREGYLLTAASGGRLDELGYEQREWGVRAIVAILRPHEAALAQTAALAERLRLPWLACCVGGAASPLRDAYAAGATMVLPDDVAADALLRAIGSLLATSPISGVRVHPTTLLSRLYKRGEAIGLGEDSVLQVERGVLAMNSVHNDGVEVLLGLLGPGQVLAGHPEDSCDLHLLAHTDASVHLRPWREAVESAELMERLRARLRQMEAWAAVQVRPYLDERVLGTLSLLGEQFGVATAEGLLIDVRITHAQLAAATGANRTTITRLLRDLRDRGALDTVGSGAEERFRLRAWLRVDHDLRPPRAASRARGGL